MDRHSPGEITTLLNSWHSGNTQALGQLINSSYPQLSRISSALMYRESPSHSLQVHGLIHEAFLRIQAMQDISWENRRHFFTTYAEIMRRVLVDHARARLSLKRGGKQKLIPFDDIIPAEQNETDIEHLCCLLELLKRKNEVLSDIIKLRFFLGLSIEETANALNMSPATVKRKWHTAKAWLYREMMNCHQ